MIGRTGSPDRYQVWTGPTDQSTDLWTRPDWSIGFPGLDWTGLVGPDQSIIWTSLVGRTIKNTGLEDIDLAINVAPNEGTKQYIVNEWLKDRFSWAMFARQHSEILIQGYYDKSSGSVA